MRQTTRFGVSSGCDGRGMEQAGGMAIITRAALAGVLVWAALAAGAQGVGAEEQAEMRPKARPEGLVAVSAPLPTAEPAPTLAAPAVAAAPVVAAPPKVTRDLSRGSVTNLPLPRFVSLKGNEGNARRGPGLTHRIDWVFTRSGMPLRITAEYEHWRRVEDAEGVGGWVHYALLSGVRSVMISADMADFLNSPEDGAAVKFRAERNVVGWVQECSADWCRVSVEGDRGWVHKSALWGVAPGEVIE
jgi:SH3-like domain-containing protein